MAVPQPVADADGKIEIPITHEVVVDTILVQPGKGLKYSAVEAALLVIAAEHHKLAEEADGTYRFVIPGRGRFAIRLDFEPEA